MNKPDSVASDGPICCIAIVLHGRGQAFKGTGITFGWSAFLECGESKQMAKALPGAFTAPGFSINLV
jgi:hypothetical protein